MKIRELSIALDTFRFLSVVGIVSIVWAFFQSEVDAQIVEQIEDHRDVSVSVLEMAPPAEVSFAQKPEPVEAEIESASESESKSAETVEALPASPDFPGVKKTSALTARQRARKSAIERCLAIYYTRQIDAGELRPWSLMHGLLAYGRDSRVVAGSQSVSAVEYLCNNGVGDDRKLMSLNGDKIQMHVGRGYQGHSGQLLAMLAQSNVPFEQAINVEGKRFSLGDLIEYEKLSCRDQTELTFKLIALAHYLDSDATWKNDIGQQWSISRMIDQEIKQPIIGAACGGTHRLMGLSYAIEMRRRQGRTIDGQWARASSVVKQHQETALAYQHTNGSFSTAFFQMKSNQGDAIDHLLATGHQLEWLVFSLPAEQLQDPRIELAIDYVVGQMLRMPNYHLDVGPRGHAIRALKLYEAAVFGASNHDQLMPEGVKRITEAVVKPQSTTVVARPTNHATRTTQATSARPQSRPQPKRKRFGRRF